MAPTAFITEHRAGKQQQWKVVSGELVSLSAPAAGQASGAHHLFASAFLPVGYPDSVTPDYTGTPSLGKQQQLPTSTEATVDCRPNPGIPNMHSAQSGVLQICCHRHMHVVFSSARSITTASLLLRMRRVHCLEHSSGHLQLCEGRAVQPCCLQRRRRRQPGADSALDSSSAGTAVAQDP
jgi:hypothetical protein